MDTHTYTHRYVRDLLIDHGHQPPEIEDVCDEIFDMVKPKDPIRITFDDLSKSGVGETVPFFLFSFAHSLSHTQRHSRSHFFDCLLSLFLFLWLSLMTHIEMKRNICLKSTLFAII